MGDIGSLSSRLSMAIVDAGVSTFVVDSTPSN